MLRGALRLGRIFGVELRVHLSLFVLLAGAVAWGVAAGSGFRGFALWLALVLAIVLREIARAVSAAYNGLDLRALLVLPIGGVMALAAPAGAQAGPMMAVAGPLANLFAGALMLTLSYACAPGVDLLHSPWIAPTHLLRSFIWLQFALAVLGLLPSAASPMRGTPSAAGLPQGPAGLAQGVRPAQPSSMSTSMPTFGLFSGLALAVIAAGLVTMNLWLICLGAFGLLGAQLQGGARTMNTAAADSMRVREVMLTDFVTLSSSDTLRSALERAQHSLQDVFPVLRGDRLVGSMARQTLVDQMQTEGDGYLQGAMTRSLPAAAPDEPLVEALRRAAEQGAAEFIPVVEDGRLLGILTPQGLGRAVQQVRLTRPAPESQER